MRNTLTISELLKGLFIMGSLLGGILYAKIIIKERNMKTAQQQVISESVAKN